MNIIIKSNFQFSVTSIHYAPNGELCIELSSEKGNEKNRYQYTANLGNGQSEELPSLNLLEYTRNYVANSTIKEKSKDPYNQMARFLEAYGDCTIDKITTEYLQGFISHLQTEDNRLTNIVDDGYFSYYAYDHSGERVLKLTGHNTVLDINADDAQFYSYVDEVTLYTSPYLVANNYGYTKHYYAGTERVCARIGNGNLNFYGGFIDDDIGDYIATTNLYSECIEAMNDRVLSWNPAAGVLTSCGNTQASFSDIEELAPIDVSAQTAVNTTIFDDAMALYSNTTLQSEEQFFYHSDHLGSASWITDGTGQPVQHLQYLPFGESFVNQRTTGYNERFTFTGKEKDSESGFYYFGARYYDCDLSGLFLSVDPMADKYPSMSPYAYCAWNPVKLIDPMGDSLKLVGTDDCKKAALSQMKSKTNNLTFSYSDDGTVSYSGNPKTEMEMYMASILDNENILINLEVQETNYNPKGNLKKGGGFYGNQISDDGITINTFQAINVLASKKYDRLCKNKGNMIWHEIAESYEGAVISLRNKTNATPARIGSYNTIYTAAHYNAGKFFPGTIKCDIFSSFTYLSHNNGVYSLETMILKTNYRYERQ